MQRQERVPCCFDISGYRSQFNAMYKWGVMLFVVEMKQKTICNLFDFYLRQDTALNSNVIYLVLLENQTVIHSFPSRAQLFSHKLSSDVMGMVLLVGGAYCHCGGRYLSFLFGCPVCRSLRLTFRQWVSTVSSESLALYSYSPF